MGDHVLGFYGNLWDSQQFRSTSKWMKNGNVWNVWCILPQRRTTQCPQALKRQPRTRPKSPFCPDLKDGSIRWSKWHGPKWNWGIPGKNIVSWCRLLIVVNRCLIQTACAQTTLGFETWSWDQVDQRINRANQNHNDTRTIPQYDVLVVFGAIKQLGLGWKYHHPKTSKNGCFNIIHWTI